MSRLYKRGDWWWIQWYDDGTQRRKTTGVRVAMDPRGNIARQVQRDHDSAKLKNRVGLEEITSSLRGSISAYLRTIGGTSAKYQKDAGARLEMMTTWFRDRGISTLDEITPAVIGDWITERRRLGRSDSTIVLELVQLCGVAQVANRTRTIKPIRWETWPKPERRQAGRPERIGAYTWDEVERFLEYFRTRPQAARWHLPILLLSHLGCRWGELKGLRVGDLHLDETPPVVRIESKKTAKTAASQHRWVEIHPRIFPELRTLTAGKKPGDLVIEMPSPQDALVVLGRACRVLEIQYRRLHGFRHGWITGALRAGVPLVSVMAGAGHRQMSTTQRYLTVDHRQVGWISQAIPAAENVSPKLSPKKGENSPD